jgi:hypothetical protein
MLTTVNSSPAPQRLDGDGNHGFIVILLVLLASLLAREEQGGYEE